MLKPFIKLTAALGLTLLAACGNSYGDRCATAVQCSGGNDNDVNACVAALNGNEQVALAYDCGDAYFKYNDCVDTTSTCDKKNLVNNCHDLADALKKCEEAASGR